MLDPIENSNGATLVYVASRVLPAEAKFEEEKERFQNQAQWSKRYAIVQGFYEDLEKNSRTVLYEPLKSQVEEAPTGR